nr:AMP-binding protein [Lachnospiraceae bacterium]
MFFELQPSDKTALISSDGSTFTYAELDLEVKKLQANLTPGKLAFCLCENSPASVMGYLACLNNRTVPLLLDKKIDRELLAHLLTVYHPDYLYLPAESEGTFSSYEEIFSHHNYKLMKASRDAGTVLYEELALLLTTSGSVGSPKLVRQSRSNLQANAESIAQYLELDENERPVTTLPMNYTYGLSIINSHLQVGATILLTDLPMNMKGFWEFMKTQKATSFGGVPFTYEMLKKLRIFKMDLPDLSYMTQAGGKLGAELHREFAEWARAQGKKFIVMYGQTEATARMAYLPAEYSVEKYGSMGRAIPGGKFTLIDVNGNEITTPDTVGELVYEGANVTLGYAEQAEDLAKGDERGGRLVTGDMAKFDEDGFFYIVGRKKRFLKVYGNRVNLDELDQLVKA